MLATQYKQALTHMRNSKDQEAISILQTLVNQHPEQPFFITALAQAESQAGYLKQSVKTWGIAYKNLPQTIVDSDALCSNSAGR